MKFKNYQTVFLYTLAVIFLSSCDSSSTSYSIEDNGNDSGGGSNNTDLPAGFSKFISEYTDVYISCLLYTSDAADE